MTDDERMLCDERNIAEDKVRKLTVELAETIETVKTLCVRVEGAEHERDQMKQERDDALAAVRTMMSSAVDRVLREIATRPASVGGMVGGAWMIAVERRRVVEQEGWTPEHDDTHINGELAIAATCYAMTAEPNEPHGTHDQGEYSANDGAPSAWPWEEKWWKPSTDRIRNLVKAGQLIAAEIDRLDRIRVRTVSIPGPQPPAPPASPVPRT